MQLSSVRIAPEPMPRIGLVRSSHPVFAEIAEALSCEIGSKGWEYSEIKGFPAGFREVDLILLTGDVALLPWVDGMLDFARRQGIPTMLWQLEPLPPRPLGQDALKIVRKLYPVLRGEQLYRFKRPRRLATSYLSWRLARKIAQAMAPAAIPAGRFRLQLISRSYQWAHDAFQTDRLGTVLAGIKSGESVLREGGIPARYVPAGHHPVFGNIDQDAERDLDVVFFGSLSEERAKALDVLKHQLGKEGYSLTIISADCYGETRKRMLNRAKVVLNLLNYPWEFPSLRMVMAMACGCLVVSDSSLDPAPFRDGEHFARAEPENIGDALLHYLSKGEDRNRLARQGHAFVTGELTLGKTILPEIEEALARARQSHCSRH
jgi:hypothetical protein